MSAEYRQMLGDIARYDDGVHPRSWPQHEFLPVSKVGAFPKVDVAYTKRLVAQIERDREENVQ